VVIDEAFGRGSDESARYGLELFQKMNLQLLIVTPLQKIHIIEPHVSAVGFVPAKATPEDLRAQVQRHWDRGRILQARARRLLASKEEEPLFPLAWRLRKPAGRDLSERFEEARRWIQALEAASGDGYEIEWEEINHLRRSAYSAMA
jgi:hypothetical protein